MQQLADLGFDPVPMDNFRSNIVVDGLEAFEEHTIKGVQHTNATTRHYQLKHCYHCQRCVIPTINIVTGECHSAQQLFSCIVAVNSMIDNSKATAFGEDDILLTREGETIQVGDKIDDGISISE